MGKNLSKRLAAAAASAAVMLAALTSPAAKPEKSFVAAPAAITADAADSLSFADFPSEYQYAADWIWNNRIMNEDSCGVKSKRYNLIFDQIIANKGELNYVVRWQSTQTITYEQRKAFETFVEEGVNKWTDYLVGFENWPYKHVDVNIVGWAVIDKSSLLDLHDDEVVWDNITEFDELSNTQQGVPSVLPCAPADLWTFNYFGDRNHKYNGQSFDEYLWCTQNYGDYGGCGGDWGQRLSDNYYLAAATGSGFPHIYWHELGHGFGQTDFYGGEGASDGFPPGGFPGGKNSIMMAGSASEITDFDAWMFRYIWYNIKDNAGRFNLANAQPETTETTTVTTTTTTETTTEPTTTAAAHEYGNIAIGISDDTIVAGGENANVRLGVSDSDNARIVVGSASLDITFDPALNYEWYDGGSALGSEVTVNGNTIHVEMTTRYGEPLLDDYGILYLGFSAPEGTPSGKYPVSFSSASFKDESGNDITSHIALSGGYIEVTGAETTTTAVYTTAPETTTTVVYTEAPASTATATFTDTITYVSVSDDGYGAVSFAENGSYKFFGTDYYGGDEAKNLLNYEAGDKISIKLIWEPETSMISNIVYISLEQNVRDTGTTTLPPETTTTAETATTTAAADDIIYGDANGDNKVSVADAVAVLQYIGNKDKYALDNGALDCADVFDRGDGVTAKDALSIQKLASKLIDSLPESYMK